MNVAKALRTNDFSILKKNATDKDAKDVRKYIASTRKDIYALRMSLGNRQKELNSINLRIQELTNRLNEGSLRNQYEVESELGNLNLRARELENEISNLKYRIASYNSFEQVLQRAKGIVEESLKKAATEASGAVKKTIAKNAARSVFTFLFTTPVGWLILAIIAGIIIVLIIINTADNPSNALQSIINARCADVADPDCFTKLLEGATQNSLGQRGG